MACNGLWSTPPAANLILASPALVHAVHICYFVAAFICCGSKMKRAPSAEEDKGQACGEPGGQA